MRREEQRDEKFCIHIFCVSCTIKRFNIRKPESRIPHMYLVQIATMKCHDAEKMMMHIALL
jgi:C4-type Zn-finger protein